MAGWQTPCVGLLAWVAIGFLAGFAARVIVRPGHRLGCLGTIAVGLAGSLVGGTIANVLSGDGLDLAVTGLVGSLLGAILILALARLRTANAPGRNAGARPGEGHRPPPA